MEMVKEIEFENKKEEEQKRDIHSESSQRVRYLQWSTVLEKSRRRVIYGRR